MHPACDLSPKMQCYQHPSERIGKEQLHLKLEHRWVPVAKLSGMLLRPEAGTIISIFYYFYLFICIFQLQSGQLRSTLLVSVHPDKLWVYLFHYHTGHRQCFKYRLTRDLVCWLISRVQTDFSAGIVIIAACLCVWPFFQLHFLHLQFLLVQILCKDMFFNVLLGNVVCGCVCELCTRHTFAIQVWMQLFQCCIFLGVFLWRCEMIISALTDTIKAHTVCIYGLQFLPSKRNSISKEKDIDV